MEYKQSVFENIILKGIFGAKSDVSEEGFTIVCIVHIKFRGVKSRIFRRGDDM